MLVRTLTQYTTGQIILVVGGLGAGGAERTLVTLAHAWSQRGQLVTILALDAAKPFYSLNSAIDFRQLPLVRQSNGLPAGLINNAWRIGRLRDALATLSRSRLISFGTETSCLTPLASLGLGHTVTVAERCDPRWYPRDRRWRVLRRWGGLRRSTAPRSRCWRRRTSWRCCNPRSTRSRDGALRVPTSSWRLAGSETWA